MDSWLKYFANIGGAPQQNEDRYDVLCKLEPITKKPFDDGRVIDPVSMREKVAANRQL
ncbi:hypothetical protein FACS1894116_07520 [Betaproteobacteria bacterium]|nr:hypothetical protein FACS1894116_07520 [Betaproteobacteria bacterium]